MKYDFTSIINRVGKDATAVESVGIKRWGNEPDAPKEGFDFIPMWVADMNFGTCPAITEAISKRLEHPLFGYYMQTPEFFNRIIDWQTERHGYKDLKAEYIGYQNGVHGCVTTAMNVLTQPGDCVLIHRPTYVGFAMDIEYQGRTPIYSDLVKDENGVYRMDYEDMDQKLKAYNIHVCVFCSPHNPAGRVWEKWELEKAMEVFERNQCYVISDEIWADIVYTEHTPSTMVNDWAKSHVISIYALSKTFNLAAFAASYYIIYDKYLRDRISKYTMLTSYNEMNVLTMHAFYGAYSEAGREWVDELNSVLQQNCKYVCNFLNSIDGIEVTEPEGTYMIFPDFTGYCKRTGKTQGEILKAGWDVGVGWQNGIPFGGSCHIRMNLAVPFERVKEACDRLAKYVLNE